MRSFFILRLFPTSYRFLGPYSEEQLCNELKLGRISLSDLAYDPENPGKWRRLVKFDHLLECLPIEPEKDELLKFEGEAAQRMKELVLSKKKAGKPASSDKTSKKAELISPGSSITTKDKIWYLQSQSAEFGPFSFIELGKIFDSGKLSGKIYVWKEGLVNWMEAQSLEQVLEELPQAERSQFVIERGSNKRIHTRSMIVATVSVKVDGKTHTGLCLDISEGGVQVGKWDAKLELDGVYSVVITPLGLTGIAPFSAESQVSWIKEKPESTGFRFKSFKKPGDQKLLIKYLNSSKRGFR